MSFLPDWWSQGTNAYTPESKFGQAGMFDKPTAQQQGNLSSFMPGEWDWMKKMKLIDLLKSNKQQDSQNTPAQTNQLPQFTPYQDQQMGPNMGQVNNPNTMSPNGQIMPNWNRNYGGY